MFVWVWQPTDHNDTDIVGWKSHSPFRKLKCVLFLPASSFLTASKFRQLCCPFSMGDYLGLYLIFSSPELLGFEHRNEFRRPRVTPKNSESPANENGILSADVTYFSTKCNICTQAKSLERDTGCNNVIIIESRIL